MRWRAGSPEALLDANRTLTLAFVAPAAGGLVVKNTNLMVMTAAGRCKQANLFLARNLADQMK